MLKLILLVTLISYGICADPPSGGNLDDLINNVFNKNPDNGGNPPINPPINNGGNQPINNGGNQPINNGGNQPINNNGGNQPINNGGGIGGVNVNFFRFEFNRRI